MNSKWVLLTFGVLQGVLTSLAIAWFGSGTTGWAAVAILSAVFLGIGFIYLRSNRRKTNR